MHTYIFITCTIVHYVNYEVELLNFQGKLQTDNITGLKVDQFMAIFSLAVFKENVEVLS